MTTAAIMRPPQRPSVRLLLMGWALWLLAVWALSWSQYSVGPKAVRMLLFTGSLGMLAAWPAVRLSQLGSVGGVLLDWIALNALWQAVIWPMATIMRWPMEQAIWLGVAMAGWSLWAGWLIAAAGRSHDGWVRAGAMAVCVALLVGEPVLMAMSGKSWQMVISPTGALWALTEKPGYFRIEPWVGPLTITTAAAVGAWGALITGLLLHRRTMR